MFGGEQAALSNQTTVLAEGDAGPPPLKQTDMLIPGKLRQEWGDFVWWDQKEGKPQPLTRDEVGEKSKIGEALLEGSIEVTLADGTKVALPPGV